MELRAALQAKKEETKWPGQQPPNLQNRDQHNLFESYNGHFAIHNNRDCYANTIWIDNLWTPVYFNKADGIIAYRAENWSGTGSFRLNLSPQEDLPDGFILMG
jgi:hypothetical protein